ncbi:MAG: peptide/nickel transport system permease protein [Alphaproteobacteria bacterium]|jgi:peptide/nickel transport system permease protein
MVTVSENLADAKNAELQEDLRDRPGLWKQITSFARKQPLGFAGLIVVLVFIFLAVFAPWLSPFDPEASSYEHMLAPPGTTSDAGTFYLGTDDFGRDVLTRIIYGARTALFVGFTCAIVGATVGLVLGVGSAFFGGKIDLIFQRIMDIFMAFPLIIMALSIVAIFGSSIQNVIIAITIPFIPRCARVVRSSALAIREIPYIDAARANGFSNSRIIMRHMVPNVMAPFLIMLTAFVGQAILLEASLSFLGLGVQEPVPAWGLMLKNAQEYIRSEPWIAIWPGIAITLGVFGFNLFGDALRDALDPRLRSNQ